MRSSLSLGVALLLTIAITPSIIQSEQTCGNLGSGTNACKCGEIVVKSAKVQKPLFYASPEAINEAAVAREAVGRLSVGTDQWQSENLISTPKYKPYTSGAFSSSSSSSSRSSSSIGILGGPIGGSNVHSPFNFVSDRVISNCGCGNKGRSESLEVRDLLSSNIEGKVVPSFPPIGDLCYPSSPSSKFQVTTKVTPAYPGKIKCAPPIPYKVCVKILNGQIDEAGLRELGLATDGSIGGSASIFDKYISNNVAKVATRYGSHAGANVGSTVYGSYAGAGAGSTAYGSYAGANAGSTAYGSYAGASAGSTAYAGIRRSSIATSSNAETIQGSTRSSCDFGDDAELPEDYSYPRLPADPVSVTLAYKNLFPRTVYYNKRAFVPEDKLAFGHRTVPTESTPSKNVPDVPEEKLQILEKPIVELKSVPQVPTIIGAYNEHEEAKLAELEAIERERINEEEIAERQQENFITYGDLGYAPINRPLSTDPIGVFSNVEDDTRGADCGPVGPPDPDYVPGSVVINQEEIVGNEDQVENDSLRNNDSTNMYVRHYDEISDDDEEYDEPISGIFARLKSIARKHGRSSSSCGAV